MSPEMQARRALRSWAPTRGGAARPAALAFGSGAAAPPTAAVAYLRASACRGLDPLPPSLPSVGPLSCQACSVTSPRVWSRRRGTSANAMHIGVQVPARTHISSFPCSIYRILTLHAMHRRVPQINSPREMVRCYSRLPRLGPHVILLHARRVHCTTRVHHAEPLQRC